MTPFSRSIWLTLPKVRTTNPYSTSCRLASKASFFSVHIHFYSPILSNLNLFSLSFINKDTGWVAGGEGDFMNLTETKVILLKSKTEEQVGLLTQLMIKLSPLFFY